MNGLDHDQHRGAVLVAGTRGLFGELLRSHLDAEGFSVAGGTADLPGSLVEVAMREGATHPRMAVILVDPDETEWWSAARDLRRRQSSYALLVVSARPTFGALRRWQQRVEDGGDLQVANGLLTLSSRPGEILEAITEAISDPGRATRFWLDGPRHPLRFWASDKGRGAEQIATNPSLHRILMLAAEGKQNRVIAALEGITTKQVSHKLGQAKSDLGATTSVALGAMAARKGLLDDPDLMLGDD